MNLVIFGPQGSGKGTQAELICDKYGLTHISTGDIFRDHISRETELGEQVKAIVERGELVPDELTNALIKDRLLGESDFLLDGYPRNTTQAEFLDTITKIDGVILLKVPDEVVIERISSRRVCPDCGATYNLKFKPPKREGQCDDCNAALIQRDDDKPQAIADRLKIYREKTEKAVEHYPDSIVIEADGTGTIAEVFELIESDLEALLSKEQSL